MFSFLLSKYLRTICKYLSKYLSKYDKGQEWYGPNRSRRYIKKRWQEYTEELYKKDLHDPDNHDGVITHLEPDPGM